MNTEKQQQSIISQLRQRIREQAERIKGLEVSEKKLRALEDVGVDNWQGYDIAMDLIEE